MLSSEGYLACCPGYGNRKSSRKSVASGNSFSQLRSHPEVATAVSGTSLCRRFPIREDGITQRGKRMKISTGRNLPQPVRLLCPPLYIQKWDKWGTETQTTDKAAGYSGPVPPTGWTRPGLKPGHTGARALSPTANAPAHPGQPVALHGRTYRHNTRSFLGDTHDRR